MSKDKSKHDYAWSIKHNYAWIITQDLDNPFGERTYSGEPSARTVNDVWVASVGFAGPPAATPEYVLKAVTTGHFFRLLDKEGTALYIGRYFSDEADQGFEPLLDWERCAADGVTEIEFRKNGEWVRI